MRRRLPGTGCGRWRVMKKREAKPRMADALKAEHGDPFFARLSAFATNKSRGLGGNYFPRRGVGRSPACQKHQPARPNSPALPGSGRCIGSPAALPPPAFRYPQRTKQGGSGEIISPGGAWGGAPHTKTTSLRYFWLTSDQDQMTRPTMDFCQSPSKSSMRLRTRGGLSAALSE